MNRLRRIALSAAIVGSLSFLGRENRAAADFLDLTNVSYTYPIYGSFDSNPKTDGGGNITGAKLNGNALAYLYCIQPQVDIFVGTTYNSAVTFDGTIDGGIAVNNAGQVAWLMDHFAVGATTYQLQGGLQAAIWATVYPSDYALDPVTNDPGLVAAYNADLLALGSNTDPVSNLAWLSNYDGNGRAYQALITFSNAVPEPSSLALGLLGFAGAIGYTARRRLRNPA
jgi:hypothetical protein